MLLDNECNKMRNPESLLEFVSSPHFSGCLLDIPEEIINGEHDWTAVAAGGRLGGGGDLALLVLSFLLLSTKDYFNPAVGQIGMIHRPPSGSHLQSVIM